VRHGLAATLLHGQAGLGTIQSLDLALLVYAQHKRVLGRIQIETDNILQLGREIRIIADLEARYDAA
jgi:hypothetical protein